VTVEVFAALADENRQQLLKTLVRRGSGASATALASALPVTRQAVERHLKVLERAGLVESSRTGREVLFIVRRHELDRSAKWMTNLADQWDRRLAAVKAKAEPGKGLE